MDQEQMGAASHDSEGYVQDAHSQVRDNASDPDESSREEASTFERQLRNTIEQQPYTAIAIALGIGWLLGRSHRPL